MENERSWERSAAGHHDRGRRTKSCNMSNPRPHAQERPEAQHKEWSAMFLDQVLENNGRRNKSAVVDGDKAISYSQLRRCSAFLAAVLSDSIGVKPNDTILIFIDKGIEAIISFFGSLKSGAAYVPGDVTWPQQRVRQIIDDCQPRAIITTYDQYSTLLAHIDGHYEGAIFIVELENKSGQFRIEDVKAKKILSLNRGERVPGYVCRNERNSDDLAYIIFTSGSGGKPKGAMIRHRSIMAFLDEIKKMGIYGSATRCLNLSPLFFDASVPDVFATLAGGGTVFLVKRIFLPSDIVTYLDEYKITFVLMISSVLRLLTSRFSKLDRVKLPHLKTIWFGGEACSIDVLRYVSRYLPDTTFLHGYGPTETTVTSFFFVFRGIDDKYRDYMPIGRPIPSVYAYALNADGKMIKKGEIGELYIGGVQLMAGYVNDPERTRQVLVEDITGISDFVYKTGDLVTLDEDDNYIFMGRNDDLTKIRGYLISLLEVQNSLVQNEKISDAVVTVVKGDSTHDELIAFIIRKDETLSIDAIMEYLSHRLPNYMIPGRYVFLESGEVPWTSNGKIDRQRLLERRGLSGNNVRYSLDHK